MKGFFNIQKTRTSSNITGKPLNCISCGLYRLVLSPKMKPTGNFKKGILIIGEAPGEREDQEGKQWQGKTGKLLQRTLEKFGIDLFEDCLNINSVNCRPIDKGNNRPPSKFEIDCCRNVIVDKVIEEYNPHLILLCGGSAVESIIGHRWNKESTGGIMKWRGWTIPDADLKAWVCPIFHPSFVERSDGDEVRKVWENDIENALSAPKKEPPTYPKEDIKIIQDLSILNELQGSEMIAIDFETTGLKPHASGHRVVSCAVTYNSNQCYVFLIPERRSERQPLLELLKNPRISKVAHNMKFEHVWSTIRLKQPIHGWFWDTMLASHILDNRPGICGLKFQAYVNLGVIDYSSEISTHLKGSENGGNSMNKILNLIKTKDELEKLLTYNALDTIYTYRLAEIQLKTINHSYLPF